MKHKLNTGVTPTSLSEYFNVHDELLEIRKQRRANMQKISVCFYVIPFIMFALFFYSFGIQDLHRSAFYFFKITALAVGTGLYYQSEAVEKKFWKFLNVSIAVLLLIFGLYAFASDLQCFAPLFR